METQLYSSIEEVLEVAKATSGHRISEYNINNKDLSKNSKGKKGAIGQIIEEGVFHYSNNSRAEPDFSNLGLELKVTGLKQLSKKKEFVAKERLVLNIIDYFGEYEATFENSSFWKKNKNLLLMFYLYEEDRDDFDFLLIDSKIHQFSKKDLLIVKQDWEKIHKKIQDGKAEEISESDTLYLGACTKGANAESSYRKQPCSDVKAKQRAYCLKTSYMNSFINENLIGERCEEILSYEELYGKSFELAFEDRFKPFYGMSENKLSAMFGIASNAKNKYNILVAAMLGVKGRINQTEEFQKANIQLKTIRVEEDGSIKEHMSFPTYEYKKLILEDWDTSAVKTKFETTKFMFVVFKKEGGEYIFKKVIFWNMPNNILESHVKEAWLETVNKIKNGDIVKRDLGNKFETNLPGPTFNNVFHTRPHDQMGIRKTNKGYELPVTDKVTGLNRYTKYCFWLDRSFIAKIISTKTL